MDEQTLTVEPGRSLQAISPETRTSSNREKGARPRLLVIGPLPPPFIGPAVATRQLLESGLLRDTFDIAFLDTSDPDDFSDIGRFTWHNVSVAFSHGWRCLRLLAAHRPDALYIPIDRGLWGFVRDMQFLLPARLLGVKVLVHLRAGRFDLIHDFGLMGRTIARVGLGGVSRGIVLGECLRDVFGTNIPPERIRIVSNGISLEEWDRGSATIERRELRSQQDDLHIVYMGNLYPGKGAHIMLAALPAIREAVPGVRVSFAGRWITKQFQEECLALVDELGIASSVDFLGGVDDAAKRSLLAGADLLVFTPIEPEGLPWVVLEAMASYLPVIGTPQGTMKEVIVDGETGYLIESGNPEALARRVVQLAADPELARRMGESGRARIENVYNEAMAHRTLVDVALEAVENGGRQRVAPRNVVSNNVMSTIPTKSLTEVRGFWNVESCGTQFVPEKKHSREFYEKFREFRYQTEWHIPLLVPFAEARGKSVLEIGCGTGADGAMFASNGADYTGVDLTEEAVASTRAHFDVLGLEGKFQIENAEELSFPDNSFDIVYSHGVLHHTVNPGRAIEQVYRVLKPGGKAIVMLYHKNSFNYYVRVMGYMRARLLAKVLPRFWRWKRDRAAIASAPLVGLRGNRESSTYELHYRNFLKEGWSYFRASNFVHHSTDGPECPFAFAYTAKEARQLFYQFSDFRTEVAHFPLKKYGLDSKAIFPVEKFLAKRIGWYLFIYATK